MTQYPVYNDNLITEDDLVMAEVVRMKYNIADILRATNYDWSSTLASLQISGSLVPGPELAWPQADWSTSTRLCD